MNTPWGLRSLLMIGLFAGMVVARGEEMPLPRDTPEAQGVSSSAVTEFVEALDRIDTMHSFMVVRHGRVIGEGWWKPQQAGEAHILNSVSKSFTSTAIGLAIEDGKLGLDDVVMKFFPDEAPENPSENLKAMKVRDLLTMTCGHETEPERGGDDGPTVKRFLAHPVPYEPGTHFQYNTMGTYVLSAILTKVTGETVLDYLKPRLFAPLGIEDPKWEASKEGNSLGGYGLYLKTEDIAKFGQLYLQKGKWQGKQLVPEKWVELASAKQVPNDGAAHAGIGNDWTQGYGFQFWRCTHDGFRGDGAGGQFCVVMPEQDVVVAMTAGGANMQAELDAIWEELLPGIQEAELAADETGVKNLERAISELEVRGK